MPLRSSQAATHTINSSRSAELDAIIIELKNIRGMFTALILRQTSAAGQMISKEGEPLPPLEY